jgi:hypothetical protein
MCLETDRRSMTHHVKGHWFGQTMIGGFDSQNVEVQAHREGNESRKLMEK